MAVFTDRRLAYATAAASLLVRGAPFWPVALRRVLIGGRRLLVISESFHPGWRVAIDGAPARALRVDGDFLGVSIPARTMFSPASRRAALRRGAGPVSSDSASC